MKHMQYNVTKHYFVNCKQQ